MGERRRGDFDRPMGARPAEKRAREGGEQKEDRREWSQDEKDVMSISKLQSQSKDPVEIPLDLSFYGRITTSLWRKKVEWSSSAGDTDIRGR